MRILLLLGLVVPALAGYVVYDQARAPVFDALMDWTSGRILGTEQDSFANWAGFMPGDVILSVNGEPYPRWPAAVGNYPCKVQRGERVIELELPLVAMARSNIPALLSGVAAALIFWASGLVLLLRRSDQAEIRLWFLLSQTLGIALLFPLSYYPKWTPPTWGIDLSVAALCVSAPLLLHHYLTFPVRLAVSPRRQFLLAVLYVLSLVVVSLWLVDRSAGRQVGTVFALCVAVGAMAALGYSYFRRASSDDRRRLRLIFSGSLLGALSALLFFLLPLVLDARPIPVWLAAVLTVAAPLSYLHASLHHNLFGIDRLLNRTLVYAALSLGILILYLGPFLLVYRFAPGDWLAQTMIAAGLTLAVGLAFEQTRSALQRLVDRLFYGGWYDYPGVVEQSTRALAGCTDRAQLADVLLRQVPALMQLQDCELTFDQPTAMEREGTWQSTESAQQEGPAHLGVPPRRAFVLSFQGRPRAVWRIGSHRGGDDLTDSDRRILSTLARQAEIALGNILLIETLRAHLDEIRASREALTQAQHRLLRSREEERARLARDLHDGPLQALIALNMQLGLLAPQSGALAAELAALRAEVRGLLAELRGVCSELRPPMLDTLGLAGALRALSDEWSAQNHVPVHLDLQPDPAFPSLPEEVAVNLYRVAQEALTNIAKHAQARRVEVALASRHGRLTMTIADDGLGFTLPRDIDDLIAEGHFGIAGLRERVNLIGGKLDLQSTPGRGTRLRVEWTNPERR